jgi:hypothetical protein
MRGESRLSITFAKAIEPILFPAAETIVGSYTTQVTRAVERWFKCHGWPTSHNMVKIPESFRR